MKTLASVLTILLLCISGWAQYTNATATVTDPNGALYANCLYRVDFVATVTSAPSTFVNTNQTFPTSYSGSCNASGVLSVRLPDNNQVTPPSSQWKFSICSSNGATCFNNTVTITGASQTVTFTGVTPLPTTGVAPTTMFFPWGGGMGLAGTTSVAALSGANKIQVSGFYLPNSVTFSNIIASFGTSDAGNNYDWGIYDNNGNLKAHVGAHAITSTGINDVAATGSPITLSAGKYYFAFTGNATIARINSPFVSSVVIVSFAAVQEVSTTSTGGALPATISVPTDSWTTSTVNVHAFVLH